MAVLNLLLHLGAFASCWTVKRTPRSPFQGEERTLILSASTLFFYLPENNQLDRNENPNRAGTASEALLGFPLQRFSFNVFASTCWCSDRVRFSAVLRNSFRPNGSLEASAAL